MPARATCRPTPRGAGSCSLAASTRRRRSSRPGFRRSRTAPSISSARSRRLQPHSPACPSREPPEEPAGPSMGSGGPERLRELLSEQGGMIATLVAPASSNGAVRPAPPSPAALAAEGPRADGRREEYELLIEAIYEGYLLHYGAPRVLEVPEADLGLLAGDQLYAIGLARLVELGDTLAVGELADTITLSALSSSRRRSSPPELIDGRPGSSGGSRLGQAGECGCSRPAPARGMLGARRERRKTG